MWLGHNKEHDGDGVATRETQVVVLGHGRGVDAAREVRRGGAWSGGIGSRRWRLKCRAEARWHSYGQVEWARCGG